MEGRWCSSVELRSDSEGRWSKAGSRDLLFPCNGLASHPGGSSNWHVLLVASYYRDRSETPTVWVFRN